VGGKDRLRSQRSGAESLEDAALPVDRDDRDQGKHGADGDQQRRENRNIHEDQEGDPLWVEDIGFLTAFLVRPEPPANGVLR
jgi:hypothetical protein